jgi:CheY-like chemotaxis protein
MAVDDDPGIGEYFEDISRRLGFRCAFANGAAEALTMLEDDGSYNVFFVDWKMPDMDGIELSRRLKERSPGNSVIIMISAADWGAVENEARAAGVDKFISKPLFPSPIADVLNECVGAAELIKQAGDEGPAIPSYEGRTILLAEDNEINREIVLALLEPANLTIDCAENGAEAVAMFEKNHDLYDLIFMDVQMPEVDGYEATRRIRASGAPEAGGIPIIAMTANVFREDIEKCLAAGMNGHVGKPLDLSDVLEKLALYVRRPGA